jgi:S-formylglutathione hydrolase
LRRHAATIGIGSATVTANSTLIEGVFESSSVNAPVGHAMLWPATVDPSGLPLVLHLHGAFSSCAALATLRGRYEAAWRSAALPPAVIACISTPTTAGFYINQPDGRLWETLVAREYPAWLSQSLGLDARRALVGFSMGGYGALKIAFAQPSAWTAVAALCPTIFPAEASGAAPVANRPGILDTLDQTMAGAPDGYSAESVYGRIRDNVGAIRRSAPSIFFDCGQEDEFRLHDGAAYLDQVLDDLEVPHVFRTVPRAAHADHHVDQRLDQALAFVGRALSAAPQAAASKARIGQMQDRRH